MEEGLIGSVLGDEEPEKPGGEEPQSAGGGSSAEAFATAIAAMLSRQDAGVARRTEEFLIDQSRLLKLQANHLEQEHEFRLHQLKQQSRLLTGQRLSQALRIAFQCSLAIIGISVCVALSILAHDAIATHSIVIEEFDAPPALATHGWTGKSVASGVLDALLQIQGTVKFISTEPQLSNAWSDDIKVEVPETGLSIGEASRLLKARFGNDLHVSGELTDTADGQLALTIRGNGLAPRTFRGTGHDVETLIEQSAEYIYAQTQPAHWMTHLVGLGKNAEAIGFAQAAFGRTSEQERPRLLLGWTSALEGLGRHREALAMARQAIRLDPSYLPPYTSVMYDDVMLEDEEAAWRDGRALQEAAHRVTTARASTSLINMYLLERDYLLFLRACTAERAQYGGFGEVGLSVEITEADIELHDLDAARIALEVAAADPRKQTHPGEFHYAKGRLAEETGDLPLAVSEMELFGDSCAQSHECGDAACRIAVVEEKAGNGDKADNALRDGGQFVDCYRFRGDILDGRGQWPEAQEAYRQAVRKAPDLPAAYYSWGLALVRHGELDAALSKFRDANVHGPHWADPLKSWGDTLVKLGRKSEAKGKYGQALQYAPNWKSLQEARASLSAS